MDELQLLRDYVQTMQRQIQSKNQQIRTLTQQNQKLIRQNQALSMKKSFVLNSTVACGDCDRFKRELYEAETRERVLQGKYDSLQRQGRASSVRVVTNSSNCTDCAQSKRELQQVKSRYNQLQKTNSNLSRLSTSTQRVYSSCSQCPRLRVQIRSKDQQLTQLQSQLSAVTIKTLSLQSQLTTLNATKLVISQPINRSNDLDRIAYLNNQVEQYLALINSLRSEIKVLNEESQRYGARVRELESRPREVQYVEKGISEEVRREMAALKIEIGELSSDNMLLRRQNANLKRQIMNLQKSQPIIMQKIPQRPLSPVQFQPRPSRHFRKSNIIQKSYQTLPYPGTSPQKLPYQQKIKYQDYERKIQLLQMQNDMLKGTFYSEI